MDHLIGQRFSLISKSEIRYVGILHEINPEQATISLEDVFSFGTEDRSSTKFIPPSQDKYDYIVFRGSDVKDIKVAEDQKENQQPSPPSVPNDPAILNASRPNQPGPPQDHRGQSPYPPPGYPPQPHFGNFPPPPHQFNRGFGPPPNGFGGPGPQFYPPPPGYFNGPPPGQGFPPGPGQYPQHPPAPIGPPGQRGPGAPGQPMQVKQTSELPDNKAPPSKQPAPIPAAPTASSSKDIPTAPVFTAAPNPFPQPTHQPQNTAPAKSSKVAPAIPFAVNQKSFIPPAAPGSAVAPTNGNQSNTSVPTTTQPSLEDASRQAKAAVAEAMAKLNPQSAPPKSVPSAAAIDALTQKVSEMGTSTTPGRGRGGFRGDRGDRGRGTRTTSGGQQRKIEIPQADYDFETANAKFNKEDLVKEAIASGEPMGEPVDGDHGEDGSEVTQERKDSISQSQPAYNKSTSFFDNISSEAREREETDGRFNGRVQRGQEFKKNIETFGQGNVDGGYRGGYRGRGRGRGFGGGRGQSRGFSGGYRGRGRGGGEQQAPAQTG